MAQNEELGPELQDEIAAKMKADIKGVSTPPAFPAIVWWLSWLLFLASAGSVAASVLALEQVRWFLEMITVDGIRECVLWFAGADFLAASLLTFWAANGFEARYKTIQRSIDWLGTREAKTFGHNQVGTRYVVALERPHATEARGESAPVILTARGYAPAPLTYQRTPFRLDAIRYFDLLRAEVTSARKKAATLAASLGAAFVGAVQAYARLAEAEPIKQLVETESSPTAPLAVAIVEAIEIVFATVGSL